MAYSFNPNAGQVSGGGGGSGLNFGGLPNFDTPNIGSGMDRIEKRRKELKAEEDRNLESLKAFTLKVLGKGDAEIDHRVIGNSAEQQEYFSSVNNYFLDKVKQIASNASSPTADREITDLAVEYQRSLAPGGTLYPYLAATTEFRRKDKERTGDDYKKKLDIDPESDYEAEEYLKNYKGAVYFENNKPYINKTRIPSIGTAVDPAKISDLINKLDPSDLSPQELSALGIDPEQATHPPFAEVIPLRKMVPTGRKNPDGTPEFEATFVESGQIHVNKAETFKGLSMERVMQELAKSSDFKELLKRNSRRAFNEYDQLTDEDKNKLKESGITSKEEYVAASNREYFASYARSYTYTDKAKSSDTIIKDRLMIDPNQMIDNENNALSNRIKAQQVAISAGTLLLNQQKFEYTKARNELLDSLKERTAGKTMDADYESNGLSYGMTAVPNTKYIDKKGNPSVFKYLSDFKTKEDFMQLPQSPELFKEFKNSYIRYLSSEILENKRYLKTMTDPSKEKRKENLRKYIASCQQDLAKYANMTLDTMNKTDYDAMKHKIVSTLPDVKALYNSIIPTAYNNFVTKIDFTTKDGIKVKKLRASLEAALTSQNSLKPLSVDDDGAKMLGKVANVQGVEFFLNNNNTYTIKIKTFDPKLGRTSEGLFSVPVESFFGGKTAASLGAIIESNARIYKKEIKGAERVHINNLLLESERQLLRTNEDFIIPGKIYRAFELGDLGSNINTEYEFNTPTGYKIIKLNNNQTADVKTLNKEGIITETKQVNAAELTNMLTALTNSSNKITK